MSTLTARLAAALEPLSPATKAELARLLMPAKKRPSRDKLLLDTRTVAELWLAGETGAARDKAERAENKTGVYRSIVVTFADGFSVRTGSYMARDDYAKAAAVRLARGRAMEREFAARHRAWRIECEQLAKAWRRWREVLPPEERDVLAEPDFPPEPDAWQLVRPCDGALRRTRACAVPGVAAVEFVPCEAAPELMAVAWNRLGKPTRWIEIEIAGEYCEVDVAALAARAEMVGRYPLPVPLAFVPPDLANAYQSASEARQATTGDSGPDVPPEAPSPDVADPVPAVAPFKRRARGKRDPRSWALVSPEGFVLYVGPKSGATVTRVEETIAVPLPLGWRRGANPWAGEDGALIVENARARVAGRRQRVRVKLAA